MAQLMLLPLTVSCSSKIPISFTFLVPAHLGSPGQRAVKRMYVMGMTVPRRRGMSEIPHPQAAHLPYLPEPRQ